MSVVAFFFIKLDFLCEFQPNSLNFVAKHKVAIKSFLESNTVLKLENNFYSTLKFEQV